MTRYLRFMVREMRGARARLFYFTLCLAVGVAAVVGVAALIASIEGGMRSQSRNLLAADLAVQGRRPPPPELATFFAGDPRVERAEVREMATMVSTPDGGGGEGRSRLCELKVVSGAYPFYGDLVLSPDVTLAEALADRGVAAATELLDGLGLELGDRLLIGGETFTVRARVLAEPDRLDFSLVLGPRVFLDAADLEETGLISRGSRVRYRTLFKVAGAPSRAELEQMEERLERELPGAEYLEVRTHHEAQPTVRRALRRVERFLGLVALLSLVLGGIGVSQIVRAWLASRTPGIAVMRCLGFRPREVMGLYLGQVTLFGLAGSVAGAAAGSLLPFVTSWAAPDLLPLESLEPWQPAAIARGLGLGLGMAWLFSLPPLTAVWRVPPARVLRAEAEPLPANKLVAAGAGLALAAGVLGSAFVQAGSWRLAAGFAGVLAAVAALSYLTSRGLMIAVRRIPREGVHPYLRHGLAALARPGAGTTGAIVALGLGIMVVLGLYVIERRLDDRLSRALPDDAPSAFFVDIQPDQWEGVRGELEAAGARGIDSVPVVMARLQAVDGTDVEDLARSRGNGSRARWILTREQRLTWRRELAEDNRVVAGALWSDPDRLEVSLEEDYAEDLGVGVGDTLTFDVQGIPVELLVTSLRAVEWESFRMNFFLVAEPGALEDAPHFRLAVGRLDPAAEGPLQDRLAAEFPNVTVLRVRAIIERVLTLMRRLALGVRVLGGFTMLAGLAILVGAVSATQLERAREAALLKTLGVTRGGVAALLAIEYGLCGLVAGLVGALGGLGLAWAFLEEVVEFPADLPWLALPATVLLGAVLTTVCGVAASARALRVRPLESLRG